jgi:hypothetical protein
LEEDVRGIKVFMRSFNDAIYCSKEIAEKDTSTDHYKNYIKVLVSGLRYNKVLIDSESRVMASKDEPTAQTFGLMKFAQTKHQQYGLDSIASIK